MGSRIQTNDDLSTSGITQAKHDMFAQPIAVINVEPQAQENVSLGNFTSTSPPSGFAVQPGEETDLGTPVVTQMVSQGTTNNYELVLRVMNHGSKTEHVKVWQM